MNEALARLESFFAIWFQSLKKNLFRVEVSNFPKQENQLKEVSKAMEQVAKAIASFKVSNLSVDMSPLERRFLSLESFLKQISTELKKSTKVEIKNPPVVMPDKMNAVVDNFPKVQEVSGQVTVANVKVIVDGLQAVVDELHDLGLEIKQIPAGGGGSGVVATSQGSHKEQTPGQTLFDANDTAPNYIGTHPDPNAPATDDRWTILKYTYSGDAVTQIISRKGAWSNRASLF